MVGNRYDLHYARSVHEQDNPNAAQRNHWGGLEKAVSWNGTDRPTGSGSASFTDDFKVKEKKVKKTKSNPAGIDFVVTHNYYYPYVVAAHDFNLNIPHNAHLYKITFKVAMKVAKGVQAHAPRGIANIYGSAYHSRRNSPATAAGGWVNGYYHMKPDVKLSTSWKEVSYSMSEAVINEGGITPDLLNHAITGIDFNFTECGTTSGNVYIKWVSIAVEYDVPDHQVSLDIPTSPEYPYYVKTGDNFKVGFWHINSSRANDVPQTYTVKTPSFGYDIRNDKGVTDSWTVSGEGWVQHYLWFTVKPHILGLNSIEVGGAKFWMYSLYGDGDDYYVVRITPNILRKGVSGCIQVNAHVFDEDGIVSFDVTHAEGYPNTPLKFDFNGQLSSAGVSVRSISADRISFNIPRRTECDVCFDVCTVPNKSGTFTFKLVDDDGDVYRQEYNVLPPYTYVFCNRFDYNDETFDMKFLPLEASFTLERMVTQTKLGMYELDAEFKDDGMFLTPCDLTLTKFEELDYVGCVPLTHSHFDPKSDYTDTLLNETYKNKTYMGKKGVIDETITLNLRVPPRDVTTLQGLVEMDKPVPINTCHTAFEGDALNHRGWVELYGVKDVEKTNPNYYKIALDVKYLTHNISYKFDILRHSKVIDKDIPTLFAEVLSFDDPLSNGLRVEDEEHNLIESSDFFDVDTDGSYQFLSSDITNIDDESEEPEDETYNIYNANYSNLFNLGEGQHVRVTSHKVLSPNVKISCSWKSNKQSTEPVIQNNSMRRVFRIRDALNKDDVLFEYTYYDFNFNELDFVKARVTSTYTGTDNNVRTLFGSEIAVMSDTDYDNEDQVLGYWYGSKVVFELNGNKLTVTDEGYNGRELYGACELKTGSYIFETEFTNILNQANLDDSFLFMDMEVMDTYLQTDYAEMYSNLVVSPFPVIGKDVVFTRQSEEGNIYYLRDDNAPFKYLLEPYYQYHCGVDLKTREGISLFNLNNSYSIFYMQNGLVRIGFNRVDGEVYLSKYDSTSQEYVTTHYFKLNANVKFEKGILTDDKIEILADTMIFTMWRGHPYIMINHPNNDIEIKSTFTKVFGETSVGGMPSLINLMNEDNLLPACVGGADISSSCIETTVNYENLVEEHAIEWSLISVTPPSSESDPTPTPISPATVSDITLESTAEFGYLFDGETNPSVEPLVKYIVNGSEIEGNTYKFSNAGIYDIYAVYLGDDLNQYALSNHVQVEIKAPTTFTETTTDPSQSQTLTPSVPTGKFTLTCDTKKNKIFRYKDNQEVKFTLRRGGVPIQGKILEIAYPTGFIGTTATDANGQVIIKNNWEVKPKEQSFYVQASFYNNEGVAPYLLYRSQVPIYIYKQESRIVWDGSESPTLNKGQYATFILEVESYDSATRSMQYKPRGGYPLVVVQNGGTFGVYHTNDDGKVNIKLTKKGTYKFEVKFAGTSYKTTASLKKNVKVN